MAKDGIGAKIKLNKKLIKQFCLLLERGLPLDSCCDMLGISSYSYWKWKQEGEAYINGGGEPKEYELSAEFLMATRQAFAAYKLARIDKMHEAKGPGWIRELAILERRDRRNFGKRDMDGGTVEDYDPDERFL